MDHDTRRFVHEAKREIKLLMAEGAESDCGDMDDNAPADPIAVAERASSDEEVDRFECELRDDAVPSETFDREIEVIMRSSIGGSANLAFFIPYLWKHRH